MLGIQIRKKWKRTFTIDHFFRLHIFFMQISGQWNVNYGKVLPQSLGFLSRYINLFYMVFINFCNFHMSVLFAIHFLMDFFSDEEISVTKRSDQIMSVILYCYAGFGGVYIQINQEKFTKLMRKMNERFHMRSAPGVTYVTVEPSYLYSNELCMLWSVGLIFGCTVLVPINLYTKMGQELIIPVWYPYDENSGIKFILTYILQSFIQYSLPVGFLNICTLLVSTVILVCGQYDILFCSLKNLRYTAILRAGIRNDKLKAIQKQFNEKEEEVNQYYYNNEQMEDLDSPPLSLPVQDRIRNATRRNEDTYLMSYHQELNQCLKDCIHHHQMILDCCMELEEFFSPVIFVKSLQITSQICNLTYISTKTTASFFVNLNKIDYLFLTLCELFLFGYGGNSIKWQSSRMTDAIVRCPWYKCGGPFRRGMLMFMASTMKPAVLTGGKFFVLDYDKMKAIITASFSYFTLLQKLG